MIKAVIFDMDGTLADSIQVHFRIWKKVLKEFDVDIKFKEWQPFIGKIGPEFIKYLNKERNLSLDVDNLKNYKKKIIDELYHTEVKPFYGAKELIVELYDLGYKLAVASSEWHDHVIDFLKVNSIDKYFSAVLGLEDIDKPKPEPDIYLKSAAKLKINPSECVVFEDSITGIEAAKTAGMKCIAVETSFDREKLRNADLIVKNIGEKEKIIEFVKKN